MKRKHLKVIVFMVFCSIFSGFINLFAGIPGEPNTALPVSELNKSQPISAGSLMYRVDRGSYIDTYFYDGTDKNMLRVKIKTCFKHKDEYRKKSLPAAELIKEMAEECHSKVSLVPLDFKTAAMLVTSDLGLLIVVLDDGRILVNEMQVKIDPDIKYDAQYRKKMLDRPLYYIYYGGSAE
ncbi:MAG: hypothetical protein WC442_04230 [Candidatus Omnitrophota bacterium]